MEKIDLKKKLVKLKRIKVELGFIPTLIYEEVERGRKYKYDGIFDTSLDFYHAFLIVNYPQNFIPPIIEGEVEFENNGYIGIKVGEARLKNIAAENLIYRFKIIENTNKIENMK